jgi:snurportin-1
VVLVSLLRRSKRSLPPGILSNISVPNTTLRSRLQGKSLIARFPSQLPPLTILDCILDQNWRDNGILHVLDVLQWKGQDVGDCETAFRFWWRDTRLGELPPSPPPSVSATVSNIKQPTGTKTSKTDLPALKPDNPRDRYQFPYPNTFLAVPYHTDTSYASLTSTIIPLARHSRSISVEVPLSEGDNGALANFVFTPPDMEVDAATSNTRMPLDFSPPSLRNTNFSIDSDGLLLYVAQASYESGTSPLSNWIPITDYTDLDAQEAQPMNRHNSGTLGPLDRFEK